MSKKSEYNELKRVFYTQMRKKMAGAPATRTLQGQSMPEDCIEVVLDLEPSRRRSLPSILGLLKYETPTV